ncbi:hypothetical protein [Sphaerisporangium sp. NPDC051011]|uniref:hypothetical protein n=1 Tax=Sphaerisporangium sp. NPDC051011 TaxID=3155792 RepID=UPI0033FF0BF6
MRQARPGRVRVFAVLFLLTFTSAAIGGVIAGMKITELRDAARAQESRLASLQSRVSTVSKETDQLRDERDAAKKAIAALEKQSGTSVKDVTEIFRDGLTLTRTSVLDAALPKDSLSVPLRQTNCRSDFDNWACEDFTTISASLAPCETGEPCLSQTWVDGAVALSKSDDPAASTWSGTGTPVGVQFQCGGADASAEMTWSFTFEPHAAAYDARGRKWRVTEYSAEFQLQTSPDSACPEFTATWSLPDGTAS